MSGGFHEKWLCNRGEGTFSGTIEKAESVGLWIWVERRITRLPGRAAPSLECQTLPFIEVPPLCDFMVSSLQILPSMVSSPF